MDGRVRGKYARIPGYRCSSAASIDRRAQVSEVSQGGTIQPDVSRLQGVVDRSLSGNSSLLLIQLPACLYTFRLCVRGSAADATAVKRVGTWPCGSFVGLEQEGREDKRGRWRVREWKKIACESSGFVTVWLHAHRGEKTLSSQRCGALAMWREGEEDLGGSPGRGERGERWVWWVWCC